jgi:hypothetical protein
VIPPDAIDPGVPAHPIELPPPEVGNPIVIPPEPVTQTFTIAVRNNATGETKMMTFVPSPEVPPATPGAGPK